MTTNSKPALSPAVDPGTLDGEQRGLRRVSFGQRKIKSRLFSSKNHCAIIFENKFVTLALPQ